jgi:hypothetical protein
MLSRLVGWILWMVMHRDQMIRTKGSVLGSTFQAAHRA